MKEADVATLLALANGHDQRHGMSDVKVRAWFVLFEQEAADMEPVWAQKKINEHYARTTDMLMPAHLVTAWKQHKRYERNRLSVTAGRGVPMPDYVKAEMQRLLSRRD
jgi:hypothetical protein